MTNLASGGAILNCAPPLDTGGQKGVELTVHGIVQGVGFRPFVYRLARDFEISGTIANTSQGVVIQAEAPAANLDHFIQALTREAPPLARISSITRQDIPPVLNHKSFTILQSSAGDTPRTMIPADIALCDDCRRELLEPTNRRYRYSFINCTNCGPRFTIVSSIPYDRPGTSMADFPMCALCQAEYDNPDNRRFHAQPNACPVCGPHISWRSEMDEQKPGTLEQEYVVRETIKALNDGQIVAIRGMGGFHLVVDAASEPAVARLRLRKQRQSKPLAVMMANPAMIDRFCHLSPAALQALTSPAHPIVLLPQKKTGALAANLAPGMGELGVMLPYTPLHHLLFATPGCPQALVMTSGNRHSEPLCTGNDEALSRLGDIADGFVLHNRDIVTRVDDSVIRIMHGCPRLLRRARGYAPAPVRLRLDGQSLPPLLACGSGLKNTFCLGREDKAFLSQHIGDMLNLESLDFYQESIRHLRKLLQITPRLIVSDLHPDYPSSRHGRELAKAVGIPQIQVQHHHAHAVAVMAEHGLQGKALAIVLDGAGLGPDNTIWGGEILETSLTGFTRRGFLAPLPLPGGDAAAHQPWRMGLAALFHLGGEALAQSRLPLSLRTVAEAKREAILAMMQTGLNTPLTSSCGRLFDAVAAILGIRLESEFEGQAAMELEAAAARGQKTAKRKKSWAEELTDRDGCCIIEHRQFFRRLIRELEAGTSSDQLALAFHHWLIASLGAAIDKIAAGSGIRTIVLSGGCLQNRIIMEGLFQALVPKGFQVFTGEEIPVNDGGVSLGQAVIGGLRYVSGNTDEGC